MLRCSVQHLVAHVADGYRQLRRCVSLLRIAVYLPVTEEANCTFGSGPHIGVYTDVRVAGIRGPTNQPWLS